MNKLSEIQNQVMWNRLISVVEEQAMTLLRTAFSTSVREAGDLSAGVFTPDGLMIAQAVTGTPGHVNTMAEAVPHFLNEIPFEEMVEGDCYVTNDPWKGTGHLHDITMVAPSFKNNKLVAFFACTAHVVDIGGRGFGSDSQSVYEEGLLIPIMKFINAGDVNRDLINILHNNVRDPHQVIGDFYSLASCNEIGHRRLIEMMDDACLDKLDDLSAFIFSRSRSATLQSIKALPKGQWSNTMIVDGCDVPIQLAVTMSIRSNEINVDFSHSDAVSNWGINCPLNYSKAYACYALKCVVAPDIPNNSASLEPFTISSSPNILNAERPAPVSLRHVMGHMVPDLVFGALAKALPGQIMAEGAAALWNIHISVRPVAGRKGQRSEVLLFNSGGMGARPSSDGLNATAFPSGVHTMPIEATEHTGAIIIWRKELRPNSGGAGKRRGGLGQIIEIAPAQNHEFDFSAMFDRVQHPARGRHGGEDGAPGVVELCDGTPFRSKGWQHVPTGKRLILKAPGGGGFGDPQRRNLNEQFADHVAEYVTKDKN